MLVYIVLIFILLFVASFFRPKENATTYGSASFSTRTKILSSWNKGFMVGTKSLSVSDSTQHMLLCSPSGMGKTASTILPNVLHLASKGHSLVILDPKLELTELCSGYISTVLKADVHVLNLKEHELSITWNPLSSIKDGKYQSLMVQMYDIVNTKKGTDSIWKFGSIEIMTICCKILVKVEDGKYANLSNLIYLLNNLQAYPKKTTQWMQAHISDEALTLQLQRFAKQEEKIFHGMLSGAVAAVLPFIPDELHAITQSTALPDISKFRSKQTCLFIALPIGKKSIYAPFITLLTSHIFTEIMNNPTSGNDKHIACIFEEFGQLYPIPNYASVVSTVRSRRVMLLHCLQNIDQLSHRYGNDVAEIIANNCAHWLLLAGIKSNKTLTYVRDSLVGTSTYERTTENDTHHQSSRYLMTKDEIRRLPKNKALFISGNLQPLLILLQPLYKSFFAKLIYGFKNSQGQLKSKYPKTVHANSSNKVEYITIQDDHRTHVNIPKKEESSLSFRERLELLLPKNKS